MCYQEDITTFPTLKLIDATGGIVSHFKGGVLYEPALKWARNIIDGHKVGDPVKSRSKAAFPPVAAKPVLVDSAPLESAPAVQPALAVKPTKQVKSELTSKDTVTQLTSETFS